MRPKPLKSERRREPREAVNVPLAILCTNSEGQETRLQAKLVDISVKGAKMTVEVKLPSGTTVYFYNHKLAVGGRGSVRYCYPSKQGYAIGVEFPSGTGWKPMQDADLLSLAERVNGSPQMVESDADPGS
jgi:hypothetical protein